MWDVQGSKGFNSCMDSIKKIRENVGLLLIGEGNLMTKDIAKTQSIPSLGLS